MSRWRLPPPRAPGPAADQDQVLGAIAKALGTSLVGVEDAPPTDQLGFNCAVLAQGPHQAIKSDRIWGIFAGIPGAVVNGLTLDATSVHLCVLYAGAVAIRSGTHQFIGCGFNDQITVTPGGQAHFIGCTFEVEAHVDNTGGVAADVHVIGCHRGSGVAHVNVTVDSETT